MSSSGRKSFFFFKELLNNKTNLIIYFYKHLIVFKSLLFLSAADGALLPSPTREKLEPVIPRKRDESKEDVHARSKPSPKHSPRAKRSQSVGPSVNDRRSPKRHPSSAPISAKDGKVIFFFFCKNNDVKIILFK